LAFVFTLGVSAAAQAAGPAVTSTHCRETEVVLDSTHSAARLSGCGSDETADLLWHLDRIDQIDSHLDGAYHRDQTGAGAIVYVMDTGVMAAHSEFLTTAGSRVIAGYDATSSLTAGTSHCTSPNKATDPCFANYNELAESSHGTAVASLVAGRFVGVAPEATIVSIRVMNEAALATTRTYLEGLDAIVRHAFAPTSPRFHTAVVNISGWVLERLATSRDPNPIPFAVVEQKIRTMIGGIDANGNPDPNGKRFFFTVAGNNTDSGCGRDGVVDRFPATLGKELDGLITVGGMTAQNDWWSGACHGGVEILAPSQSVFSASISATDHYRGATLRSGTSFGAPIIAGIAARMLSAHPELSPAEIEAAIEATPSRISNPDAMYADGRVAVFPSPAPARPAAWVRTASAYGFAAENGGGANLHR
jgi:subtilisin family serine protease